MKRGLEWYPREPRSFLDGVRAARMSVRQVVIYGIIIDLIYDGGGETPNDPKHIASYLSDLGTAAARATIQQLIDMGKLFLVGGMLHHERAETLAKTRGNLRETRAEAGRLGGISSGKSRRKSLENIDPNEANASSKHEPEKRREEKEEEGAHAREAISGFSEDAADPKDPDPPQSDMPAPLPPGLLDDLRHALGIQPHAAGPWWSDPTLTGHVRAWIGLGLSPDRIVAEAKASRAKNPEPPDGPKALDRWMAQAAASSRSAGALKPGKGAAQKADKPPVSPEDRMRFYAEWLNNPGKSVPPSLITNTMRDALLQSGLVTAETMRERGIH